MSKSYNPWSRFRLWRVRNATSVRKNLITLRRMSKSPKRTSILEEKVLLVFETEGQTVWSDLNAKSTEPQGITYNGCAFSRLASSPSALALLAAQQAKRAADTALVSLTAMILLWSQNYQRNWIHWHAAYGGTVPESPECSSEQLTRFLQRFVTFVTALWAKTCREPNLAI